MRATAGSRPLPGLPAFTVFKGIAVGLPSSHRLESWNLKHAPDAENLDYVQLSTGEDALDRGLIVSSRSLDSANAEGPAEPNLLEGTARLALMATDLPAITGAGGSVREAVNVLTKALSERRPPWTAATLRIEADPTDCLLLSWSGGWLAILRHHGTGVGVVGHGLPFDDAELVRLSSDELRTLTEGSVLPGPTRPRA